jgi:hypothetical protein
VPAGNLGDPKAEVPRGNQAGRQRLPGTTFCAKDPLATLGRGGRDTRHGDRGAERRARRLTCAERHERVSRGVSAPRHVFDHFAICAEWSSVLEPTVEAIASHLMRHRDENGQRWGDLIDFLTMWPDARRQVVRLLAEINAST